MEAQTKTVAQSDDTYDVGILGWWYGKNYGSILTYYGLNKAVSNLGYSVLMVHESLGYNGWRVKWPADMLSMKFAERVGYNYTEQSHFSELPGLNSKVGTFIVGSDQLWNPVIGRVNDDLFLDFVAPENKRIAYATSFGNANRQKFNPEFVDKTAAQLQKFNAISVREKYAIDIAKDIFGVGATQVVDPVFLLPREDYDKLADGATVKFDGNYLAAFFLDPSAEKKRLAEVIANKLGIDKIVIIPNPDDGRKTTAEIFDDNRFEIMAEDSPENFLSAYRNAKYVLTDSFHGSAFAAIFNKPFSSIYNTKRGADRFKSLMGLLGFGDNRRVREIDTPEMIGENPNVSFNIDYSNAQKHIEERGAASMRWLKEALALKANSPQRASMAAALAKIGIPKPKAEVLSRTEKPDFKAGNDAWTVKSNEKFTLLSLGKGKSVKGNLVWWNLPQPLTKDGWYRVTIKWAPRTASNSLNVHLRNSATGKFAVIGKILGDKMNGEMRTDVVEFPCPDSSLNQLMFGAVHFTGENPGANIESIVLEKIAAKGAVRAKKPDPKSDLAIPKNTPDRSQIIHYIMNDPKVKAWRADLISHMPDLTFYVAREMKEYTNNKVGGPADILAFPKSIEEVCQLVRFANDREIPLTILGRCSNVIVRDGGIRGIVLSTVKVDYIKIEGDVLITGAGASLIETAYYLLDRGKSSLEWAAGIPGTVGGAVFMNAGTNVSDIRRTIKSVQVLNRAGEILTLSKKDIAWGKRYTTFQDRKDWIILEASFHITDSSATELHQAMIRTVQVRENHFPLQNPNHGSTFKWWRAPRLISQAGLVGTKMGGVQISDKQPGFFVNVKQATASDYEALINYTIAKVYEFSGFLLEPEVEIIGERPHRYERYDVDTPSENLDKR